MKIRHNRFLALMALAMMALSSCQNRSIDSSSSSSPSISESSSLSESSSSSSTASSSESSSSSPVLGEYYASLTNLDGVGTSFRNTLQAYIDSKASSTCSYSGLDTILRKSDADPKYPSNIIGFYTEKSISSFNKEHVWPDSRGVGQTGPGCDPQMIRPTDPKDNSGRGNMVYGTVANSYDPASLGYPYYRGISARIIFYTCLRYWNKPTRNSKHLHLTDTTQPNSTSAQNTDNQMGRISELLKWNEDYPIDEKELRRNDTLEKLGYARNPFIDHPEWVSKIWDVSVVTSDIDTCYYRVA